MSSYCTESDLYAYGLPRGSLPNPGRVVDAADVAADAIPLDVHGFELDSPLSLRAEDEGALPTPLAENTQYYAIPVTGGAFQISATPAGAAITLTDAGSIFVVIAPLPIASAIMWASGILDDSLPSHVVPLEAPLPPVIVATCAELANWKILGQTGAGAKTLGEMIDLAQKRIARWARGVPIRGENVPPAAGLAAVSTEASTDLRGWGQYGGIG